jgi:hypothetical protein
MTTTYCIVRQHAASGTGATEAIASLQARVARSEGRLLHSIDGRGSRGTSGRNVSKAPTGILIRCYAPSALEV